MNTQQRTHRLEAGQALPLSRRTAGTAVLAEGELLVQPPATWLGGQVFVPPAVRLVAPTVVPASASDAVVALTAATVVAQEAAHPFTAAAGVARAIRRWSAGLGRRSPGRLAA